MRGDDAEKQYIFHPLCPALVCSSFFAFSRSLSISGVPGGIVRATKASRRAAKAEKTKPQKNMHCSSEKRPLKLISHLEKVSEIHRAKRRGLSLSGALRGARAHACTDRDVRREQRARRRVVGPGHGERKKERKSREEKKKTKNDTDVLDDVLDSGRFYTFKLQPDVI